MKCLASIVLLFTACGVPGTDAPTGVTQQPGTTRPFVPASIDFERYSNTCGVHNPPFDDTDLYGLDLTGDATVLPLTAIDLTFHPTFARDQNVDVALQPYGILGYSTDANGNMTDVQYGQSGTLAPNTDNTLVWYQGSPANEFDTTSLVDAVVRFVAFPESEGDEGIVDIDLDFQDGGALHLEVVEPVTTSFSGCGAG
jgi:hypothetical protein